jgi:hypothetical protein
MSENPMTTETKKFTVTFIHWDICTWDEESKIKCDFCELKYTEWWCEALVTGYCKDCMAEQSIDIPKKEKYDERYNR